MTTQQRTKRWLAVLTGSNLVVLNLLWLRLILARARGTKLTSYALLGITIGYVGVMLAPWLLKRLVSEPFDTVRAARDVALICLGYGLLLLGFPNWFGGRPDWVWGPLLSALGAIVMHAPRNSAVGVRLIWTYSSPVIWRRVNDWAGWCLVIGGVVVLATRVNRPAWATASLLLVAVVVSLSSSGLAYCLARAERQR